MIQCLQGEPACFRARSATPVAATVRSKTFNIAVPCVPVFFPPAGNIVSHDAACLFAEPARGISAGAPVTKSITSIASPRAYMFGCEVCRYRFTLIPLPTSSPASRASFSSGLTPAASIPGGTSFTAAQGNRNTGTVCLFKHCRPVIQMERHAFRAGAFERAAISGSGRQNLEESSTRVTAMPRLEILRHFQPDGARSRLRLQRACGVE